MFNLSKCHLLTKDNSFTESKKHPNVEGIKQINVIEDLIVNLDIQKFMIAYSVSAKDKAQEHVHLNNKTQIIRYLHRIKTK